MGEQNLFEKIANGNEKAFDLLFRKYYTRLLRVSVNIVKQKAVAEDIVQKVFVDLWLKKSQITITNSIEAYLKKATIFKSIDFVRKQTKDKEKQNQLSSISTNFKSFSPEDILLQEEAIQSIYQKIEALPTQSKRVFKLSRFEHLSHQEISDQLNISKKTVEYHISKALQILRESIFILLFIN